MSSDGCSSAPMLLEFSRPLQCSGRARVAAAADRPPRRRRELRASEGP
jgi:hypothetical protein